MRYYPNSTKYILILQLIHPKFGYFSLFYNILYYIITFFELGGLLIKIYYVIIILKVPLFCVNLIYHRFIINNNF